MIVDAKNILTAEMMADFLKAIPSTEDIILEVGDFSVTTNKYGLKAVWKTNTDLKTYFEAHQSEEFDIVSSNGCMMILTYYDYSWWNANTRRINKLFNSLDEELKASLEKQYTVACGMKKPGTVYDIHIFTGSKKQCIDFFNTELKEKTLKNIEGHEIVLCISYSKEQKNTWRTFNELKQEGVIL